MEYSFIAAAWAWCGEKLTARGDGLERRQPVSSFRAPAAPEMNVEARAISRMGHDLHHDGARPGSSSSAPPEHEMMRPAAAARAPSPPRGSASRPPPPMLPPMKLYSWGNHDVEPSRRRSPRPLIVHPWLRWSSEALAIGLCPVNCRGSVERSPGKCSRSCRRRKSASAVGAFSRNGCATSGNIRFPRVLLVNRLGAVGALHPHLPEPGWLSAVTDAIGFGVF